MIALTSVRRPAILLASLCVALLAWQGVSASDMPAGKARAALQKRFPDTQIGIPRPSVIPGFFEVPVGSQVLYVSFNGRYLVAGDLIDMERDNNLSETRRMQLRREAVEQINPAHLITVGSNTAPRYITVFSDVNCDYCRRLHGELQKLVNRGDLQVRYVLMLKGMSAASYVKNTSVWCSPHPIMSLQKAMAGETIPPRQCRTPINQFIQTAKKINVRGLPTIVFDDGNVMAGFTPATEVEGYLRVSSR